MRALHFLKQIYIYIFKNPCLGTGKRFSQAKLFWVSEGTINKANEVVSKCKCALHCSVMETGNIVVQPLNLQGRIEIRALSIAELQ